RMKAVSPMADDEPVAIIGLACRVPGAADPEAFWQLLVGGVEAVGEMPRKRIDVEALFDPDASVPGRMSTRRGGFLEQVDLFDAGFFGMSPREALEVDPQQRLILELAWEALERAGIAPSQLHGSRTGVFMGAMWSDYGLLAGGIDEIAQHSATGRDTGIIANRVSYLLGLTGPSMTVNTACSSSLVAVHLACRSLRSGESTTAFAGGVNLILTPDSTVAMTKFGAMAPDGRSKAFDARANGYVRGEGAGIVLLKPLSRALADGDPILALVRGSAVNNDGPSNGLTAPSPDAQRAVLRDACDDANMDPGLIDYVEAHGTGTMLGDPIEAASLGLVLGQARDLARPLLVGSVKTNIGHLEAAAGITGMIKTVLALGHRAIPPSLHFESPNPHIDFERLNLRVVTANRPWPAAAHSPCAGVSSFGFGGTNAHVVLQAWEGGTPRQPPAAPVSASPRPLVFVYSGNGAQWAGMGRDLLGTEPAFRTALQACDAAFKLLDVGFSVIDEIIAAPEEKRLADTVRAQVLMFSVQLGLTRLLQLRGFVPDAVTGHSLGEIAAAHVAGALSLNDAARIVFSRSRLQAQAAGSGAMAVIELPWAEATTFLSAYPSLVVAGANTPDSAIIAGPSNELAALLEKLAGQGVVAQRIRVDVAYHSPAMDALCAPLADALAGLVARPSRIPFYSTVDAAIRPGESLDAAYWARNLRQPVRFAETLAAMPDGIFVEISPHPILSRSINSCLATDGRAGPVAAVLSRDEAAGKTIDRLLASLSAEGVVAVPFAEGRSHHLLTLSARDADALQELAGRYARALPEALADACFTASTGRDVFAHRLAVIAPDAAAMRILLARYANSQVPQGVIRGEVQGGYKPDVTLHFGHASQLSGIDSLLASCTPFADSLHSLYPVFHDRFGVSWPAWLAQSFASAASDKALQRALSVAVGYSFARLLQAWGVRIASFTGDGPGALTAEALAGNLPLAQAILDAANGADAGENASSPALAQQKPGAINIIFGDVAFDLAGDSGCQTLALQQGDAWAGVLDVMGRLFAAGVMVDWQAFYSGMPRNRVLLPVYAFQRRRYWPKNAPHAADTGAALYALEWQAHTRQPALPVPAALVDGLSKPLASDGLPAALDQLASAYAAAALGATSGGATDSVFKKRQLAGLQRLAVAWQGEDAEALFRQLQKHPSSHIELALVGNVGRNLAAVLDGRMSPIDLLFPEGSMDQLQALYEKSAFALTLAEWMRSAFAAVAAGLKSPRVLEIGAGTGGTTAHLLPLLPPGGEYLFSDVSRAFLERATERFGATPGFATALVDIEAVQGGQDIASGNDVVIAVNVLHATRDLHATLSAVRSLLRPGGLLLLGEITGAPGWLDLVFGLLEGWWRFEDTSLRADTALLTPTQWRALLAETGFDDVAIAQDSDRQGLIVARAGPVPGRRLVLGSGALARRLADALAERGMAAEQHDTLPPGGQWLETIVCDQDQTAAQACEALGPVFADSRFGRVSLVHLLPASPSSAAGLAQSARQAARHAFALSSGAANPSRWGGTLQIDGATLDTSPEVLSDFLLQGPPEDCSRVTAQGLEVARVKSISSPATGGLPVHPDRCYLITGGFGALGFAFARWLAGRGARHIALVGRHPPGPELQVCIDELRSTGVKILAFSADVTDHLAMSQVFADLDAQALPLAGVVHAAGNAAFDAGSALAVKLEGAKLLDLLTRDRPLDLFLLFSSAAGTWGAAGKEAYAAANAALDAFAEWRRSTGRPALAVAWGRFSVRGLLSAPDDAALAEMGMQAMPPDQAFDLAWRLSTGPRACAVIADVDWARFRAVCEARAERPLLRSLPKAGPALLQKLVLPEKTQAQLPVPVAAQSLPVQGNLIDAVRQTVAEVLGHEDASVLSSTQGLFDLGLDSLLAVRLRSTLEARFGLSVPTAILFSYPTIGALADWLASSLSPEKAGAPAAPESSVQAEADMAIAVIGIGCRFPGGVLDPASFEELLFGGVNAITEVPAQRWNWREWTPDASQDAETASNRWGGFLDDVDSFDAAFFGITPKEAAFMDPQQRLLLETAWQAVEHAGIAPTSLAGRDVGVFVGITGSDYAALARRNRESGLEAQAIVGQPSNASAGRISFTLGLTGPAMAVDTACSSSLVAIHLACRALRAGDCSSALAGGVNLMLAPETSVILARAGMLSPNGQCRAFDASADGFVRAEGCGMVLLKPLQQAIKDGDTVLAVVRGSALNHDGRASGFTVPNGSAQQAVLRAALHDARLSPGDVAYIEAHGTGTALGDPIEAHAMGAVFGGRAGGPLLVGSVKTNIGHAESAAGVAGFIKTVLALQRGRIPPTLHFRRLNPHISTSQALLVPSEVLPFPALDGRRIAGVSAFGASGTNAHLLLEAAAPLAPPAVAQQPPGPHLLVLSARHADSLRELGKSVGEQLDEQNLADIAFSAAHARSALAVRGFVLLESAAQGRAELAKMPVASAAEKPRLAFLFTGQGSQYAGMARDLYQSEAAFRAVWDRCDAIALPLLGESLTRLVFDAPSGELLDQTGLAQPALFALGCALAALWREHGVEPDVVLGHSVGEFAAAVSAGILTLEAGMALVIERGRLMQALPAGGGMLALRAGLDALHPFMAAEPELSLAAENGPAETVLSGPLAALQRLAARLSALDIPAQQLATSHAFHSSLMEPMLGPLRLAADAIEHSPTRISFISNLDGAVRSSVEPAYWSQHAREPVRFAHGLRRAQALGCTVFVEIGPHAVLTALAGRVLDQAVLVPSMRRGTDERRTLLEAFGLAWQAGVAVRLPALQTQGRRVALPTTPFRRVRHWLDWATVDPVISPANTAQACEDCLYQIDWQSRPLVKACPDGVWLLAGAADESA
ncbi:MAG: SDR family NAD(P)-dependent oxidoreductase, partial [Pseudomonadota bacterium]